MKEYNVIVKYGEDCIQIKANSKKEAELKVFDLLSKDDKERYISIKVYESRNEEV